MDSSRTVDRNDSMEVNLKDFFKAIFRNKLLFLMSLITCLALAYLYNKIATPIYQAGTSILIDASGNNRSLGESQYGKLSLIEMEKNIFNEMGVLQSFALVKQTLEELDYGITYESGQWYKMEESDGYFPFQVDLLDSTMQVYNTPFEIKLLSDEKYELKIESEDFFISNPASSGTRKVDAPITFSKIYTFGEEVQHEYFNFVINKPSFDVITEDFTDQILHATYPLSKLERARMKAPLFHPKARQVTHKRYYWRSSTIHLYNTANAFAQVIFCNSFE